jgi:hypothetical protein
MQVPALTAPHNKLLAGPHHQRTSSAPGHIFVFKHKAVAGEMADMTAGTAPAARAGAAREVLALRNLVAVYRHLSGLAVQDADLAAVTRLIAEQTGATVAIVSPTMDIVTAAAPGETGDRAAQSVRDLVVHPRLGEVLAAASRARRPLRLPGAQTSASVIVAPVLVGDDVPAHLLALGTGEQGTGEDSSLLLTEHDGYCTSTPTRSATGSTGGHHPGRDAACPGTGGRRRCRRRPGPGGRPRGRGCHAGTGRGPALRRRLRRHGPAVRGTVGWALGQRDGAGLSLGRGGGPGISLGRGGGPGVRIVLGNKTPRPKIVLPLGAWCWCHVAHSEMI